MSFNFHNHKMRTVTTEEKPVSFNIYFTPAFFPVQTPNTPRPTRVLDALLRGLEKIKQGWTKGTLMRSLGDGRMQYCARGALVIGSGYNTRAEGFLYRALPSEIRVIFINYDSCAAQRGDVIAYYNDLGRTSEADIHALYDRAIALAQAEGA